jgi:hypothetical protein
VGLGDPPDGRVVEGAGVIAVPVEGDATVTFLSAGARSAHLASRSTLLVMTPDPYRSSS